MIFRIKQFLFHWAYLLDQMLPRAIGMLMRNRCRPGRLLLDTVEIHMADQCNMNCTGCSHFSPFARPWLADPDATLQDLKTLAAKFPGGLRHINLLGGEPLLHPKLEAFLASLRAAFPRTILTVVTNGLILAHDAARRTRFLAACRAAHVRVKWTLYPPLDEARGVLEAAFCAAGIDWRLENGGEFWARLVPNGRADGRRSFRFCHRTTYCPYLREGRLYPCAQAYHLRDYARAARAAGQGLTGGYAALKLEDRPESLGVNVYDAHLTGRAILAFLMTPGPVCRYCADSHRVMPWSRGSRNPADWRR